MWFVILKTLLSPRPGLPDDRFRKIQVLGQRSGKCC
jgi:hypothetical protein